MKQVSRCDALLFPLRIRCIRPSPLGLVVTHVSTPHVNAPNILQRLRHAEQRRSPEDSSLLNPFMLSPEPGIHIHLVDLYVALDTAPRAPPFERPAGSDISTQPRVLKQLGRGGPVIRSQLEASQEEPVEIEEVLGWHVLVIKTGAFL